MFYAVAVCSKCGYVVDYMKITKPPEHFSYSNKFKGGIGYVIDIIDFELYPYACPECKKLKGGE